MCLMQSGPDSRSPRVGAVSPRAAERQESVQERLLRGGEATPGDSPSDVAALLSYRCSAKPIPAA